jgi:riboflavin kinase/FMN adenylyltransferase
VYVSKSVAAQDTLTPTVTAGRGDRASEAFGMKAIVIGNFDGVHCGHRQLFCLAKRFAEGGSVTAITFEPLPVAVLRPERPMGRLTPNAERRQLLREACGVDEVIEIEPTAELLGRSPEEFIEEIHARVRFDAIVEGPDFRFGKGRSGSMDTLRTLGGVHGFSVHEAEAILVELVDGSVVEARSSVARALLAQGRVADAARVFGRAYELRCPTVRGDQRGRTIGWPTMNLNSRGRILPADGVYAGSATLPDGTIAIAAISIGTKPTFGESERTCEATLLAADGKPLALALDWYGFELRLRFHHWIRAQEKFDSIDALLSRMEVDRAAVRSMEAV